MEEVYQPGGPSAVQSPPDIRTPLQISTTPGARPLSKLDSQLPSRSLDASPRITSFQVAWARTVDASGPAHTFAPSMVITITTNLDAFLKVLDGVDDFRSVAVGLGVSVTTNPPLGGATGRSPDVVVQCGTSLEIALYQAGA